MRTTILSLLTALSLTTAASAATVVTGPRITGDYLEARSCDVYIGPCFANAEVGLVGELAIMAWSVKQGRTNGVDLAGLSVIAVVRANTTLGDLALTPVTAKAVLIVDERATAAQRDALVAFAREMGGTLLTDVARVHTSKIEFSARTCEKSGCAKLVAGDMVRLETRCLHADDHKCGNQLLYYPPLSPVQNAVPAMALTQEFQGKGLDMTWKLINKTSGFLAGFSK